MKKSLKQLIWMIPIMVFMASCFPEFDATTEELDVAITRVDEDQDFSPYHTFFLYDTVMYIIDEDEDPEDLDRTHDEQIISEVKQHFISMGWEEITDTTDLENEVDVSIMLSALAVDVYFYYTYWWDYWYWWNWYPWYPGGPIYPVYPGYGYPSYGYSVGTVMVDMVDLKNIVPEPTRDDEKPPRVDIIWSGAINGILAGSDTFISERITKQMNQVFKQSPYLVKPSPAN